MASVSHAPPFREPIVLVAGIDTDDPTSGYAADLDGDGNLDVFSAPARDNKIAWCRNERITGISGKESVQNIPKDFCLFPNYPNPFNLGTHLRFGSPVQREVTLEVYDVDGKKVGMVLERVHFPAGVVDLEWKADEGLPPGVYFVWMIAESKGKKERFHETRKMMLIK